MNCPICNLFSKKNGKDRNGNQRFKCLACGKRFNEPKDKPLGGMYLSEEKALMCLNLLVEGTSIRATERITNVNRNTILSLLETVGKKCLWIQENLVKNVKVTDVQADKIWAFIGMKQKTANNNGLGDNEKVGSAYVFTSIESNSKLIVAWHLGKRNEQDALLFLEKLYNAIDGATNRFQMSTDAFKGYDHTVNEVLGTKADYGQIIKIYGKPNPDEVRYSSGDVIEVQKKIICGNPIEENISTSYIERSNLTMRMSMRRLTRLTNGFSKKWENLNYALALYFAYYNFCRIHKTIRCTPAMEAGITKTIWTLKDILNIEVK
ncbi:MAG: IS1 family transposase [Acidobacteria bacterium]|nr:IS1 family transposase [Acidobacteriota bacterium]MCA1639163.1 IS1 family transposase [Acidobacteriota bacterium]